MALVPREVLLIDQEVVVRVQLPEPAVQNVEVLVREILANLVDVFLRAHLLQHVKQVRVFKVAPRDLPVVVRVESVKDAHDYCVGVALLELWRLLEELELQPGGVTVLCPGAEFGAAKKWPGAHYAEVAGALLAADRQVWLMGSPSDVDDCAAIAGAVPGVQNLAGRTSLLDAVDLLSVADAVVCNDSGLMHVACALDKPTVGIFGSTSAEFTPPLGERAVVVEQALDCRPCFQRTCPLGHTDCLRSLLPERVIAELSI